MKRFLLSLMVAGVALGISSTAANAQLLFTFTTTFSSPNTVPPNVPVPSPGPATVLGTPPGDNVLDIFPNDSGPIPQDASGIGTDIVLTNIFARIDSGTGALTNFNAPYTITLTLTDQNPGANFGLTGDFVINGTFTGTVKATQSNITTVPAAVSTTLTIGTDTFFLSQLTVVPPQNPGSANAGSIGAHIRAPLTQVPEPSSMGMLIGSTAGGLWLLRRRRRP